MPNTQQLRLKQKVERPSVMGKFSKLLLPAPWENAGSRRGNANRRKWILPMKALCTKIMSPVYTADLNQIGKLGIVGDWYELDISIAHM
jgi:hypothetical protein